MSEVVDIKEELADLINDELCLYFGHDEHLDHTCSGDMELAWFITQSIVDNYAVLQSLDSFLSSVTVPFTATELEDIFHYCNEKGLTMNDYIKQTILDGIS